MTHLFQRGKFAQVYLGDVPKSENLRTINFLYEINFIMNVPLFFKESLGGVFKNWQLSLHIAFFFKKETVFLVQNMITAHKLNLLKIRSII